MDGAGDELGVSVGHNVDGCEQKNGQTFVVSKRLFGTVSKAVCLLTNGETWNIYVSK